MVSTLGLHELSRMRVFVDLQLARLAATFFSCNGWSTSGSSLWIKNGHDITQAVTVLVEQITKLLFEFDFALQSIIIFKGLKFGQLSGELLL